MIPNYLSLTFYSEELILTFLSIRKSSRLSLCFSVQLSSVTQLCPTLCNPMDCRTLRLPCPSPTPRAYSNSCPSHQQCHPTISRPVVPFSSHLQSFPASGSFQMSVLHIRWLKYWNFSFSISPSNEYSGLISFRMDWVDLLVVQGTLKSLLDLYSIS